jgi:hypothetical protein
MKSKTLTCIAAAALFVTLPISIRLLAQGKQQAASFTAGPNNLLPDVITWSTRADVEPSPVATTDVSGPNAILSPTSVTFAGQMIGTVSPPIIVELINNGTARLTITSIGITGLNPRNFAQTHTCGSFLPVGSMCLISVTFEPNAIGTRTAILSVHDNAANSPQKVALSGTGVAGRCLPSGVQCPSQGPPCCPGLHCVALGNRHFCH